MSEWIRANSRLPDESGYTIVYCTTGASNRVSFAKYFKRLKTWELVGARSYWRVTHWMPMPEPPQEDEK